MLKKMAKPCCQPSLNLDQFDTFKKTFFDSFSLSTDAPKTLL